MDIGAELRVENPINPYKFHLINSVLTIASIEAERGRSSLQLPVL